MRTKLLRDISASSTQVLVNQLLGLLLFFITSRYLDKAAYGEFNWSLAVLTFITTILSLRLEQVIVRKVAAGEDPSKMLSVFFGHVFVSGTAFYLLLALAHILFPHFFNRHLLLLSLAVAQLLSFFSLPFKQLATGKEKFGWLAVMSSVANIVRSVWLVIILFTGSLTMGWLLTVYSISALAELVVSVYLVRKKMRIRITRWPVRDYCILLKESLPQIGVVFLNACIARIDWILLGFFSTQVVTAEYSFAYRVFELSPLPLLIIGPVLLTRFSAWFGHNGHFDIAQKEKEIHSLVRAEMILATFLPLLLNIAWAPMMDFITQGKYGTSNQTVFLILSICIPFQYIINLHWTTHFAQGHLSLIFRIALVTCSVIVVGDCVLIPFFSAKGAAVAYLCAMVTEYVLYTRSKTLLSKKDTWMPLVTCVAIAFVSGSIVYALDFSLPVRMLTAGLIYVALLIFSGQLRKQDILFLKTRFSPGIKYKAI